MGNKVDLEGNKPIMLKTIKRKKIVILVKQESITAQVLLLFSLLFSSLPSFSWKGTLKGT